ncbi:hypothetical protein [Rhabdaerophilum sp. SD176]|uniref:hypothetical protein n=1 Tax=Rhabdaerophilum sp. SD176 TaxID=2983548 RepID=UPI0024DF4BE5|nr:hypothetical protein [Rhabdaerophilum sp. SD176]
MPRLAILVLIAGLAGGCATWPEPGTGGFAERRPVEDPGLQGLTMRYETLRQRGAERWAAGLADEARLLLIRAQRNHQAGLADDLAEDQRRLARVLDTIEPHLRSP